MFAKLFCAALFTIVALVACSTRGEDCESDSDCDSQQSCISPGCGGPKKCAITCGTDADCKSKGGDDNDRCVKPNKDCVAYCTPG